MKLKQDSPRNLLGRGLVLISVIMLLGCTQNISAQWTTNPSPDTNIYYNAGNVGIGTASPLAKGSFAGLAGSPSATDKGIVHIYAADVYVGLSIGNYAASPNGMWLQAIDSRSGSVGNYPIILNPLGGKVGIGTTSPGYDFHLRSSAAVNLAVESAGAGATAAYEAINPSGSWEFGTNNGGNGTGGNQFYVFQGGYRFTVQNSSGNIGFGTTAPQALGSFAGLHGSPGSTDKGIVQIYATDVNVGLSIGNYSSSPFGMWLQSIDSRSGSLGNYPIILNPLGGNVGIGILNPTHKLDVSGDIYLTGTINAKYQDVAEWVLSSEQIATGTVVVLDSTKSNHVISSTEAYDTRVAGVISEQPGVALGESGANKVLVATTGRVLVKVEASSAPIHIGDLLVTSDIPGLAMKSEPITIGNRKMHMPGTLIGKALEPWEKGSGKILVLLSLQ